MKQKIVIRMSMNHDKCRSKALKIAVGVSGVEYAGLTGDEKNQVEVVGDGIDSVDLTRRLRKKVAYAELVSVGEAKKEESADKTETAAQPPVAGFVAPPCYWYKVRDPYYGYGPSCNILRCG
ncbi:Copper chaperone [Handroanthus impetiginosus]|uniref:Copper chaperone n=1 Tax=Handroanthus impetiginosus TaxID=429701 RepID=A0A2G9G9G2_9LAMI|nr:Copper chaperone [Handroanthus impetiginosus]